MKALGLISSIAFLRIHTHTSVYVYCEDLSYRTWDMDISGLKAKFSHLLCEEIRRIDSDESVN